MSLDISLYAVREVEVFEANITHNLTKMADEAGLYKALWRPDELGIDTAKVLIPLLENGLKQLQEDPERFKKLNPENGWGTYEALVSFTERYLEACNEHPDARIYISR